MVVVAAHCPVYGVKVYVVVVKLLNTGDHVPLIPLLDVVGKPVIPGGGSGDANELEVALLNSDVPAHCGATCVNVGMVNGVTFIVSCFLQVTPLAVTSHQ
jgi:hypothetical protein